MNGTRFTVDQLAASQSLGKYPKDAVKAVLTLGGTYSLAQAERLICEFLKRKVN